MCKVYLAYTVFNLQMWFLFYHELTAYSVTDIVLYIPHHAHRHVRVIMHTYTEGVQCMGTLPVCVQWELTISQLLILITNILFQFNHDRVICNAINEFIQVVQVIDDTYILNIYMYV